MSLSGRSAQGDYSASVTSASAAGSFRPGSSSVGGISNDESSFSTSHPHPGQTYFQNKERGFFQQQFKLYTKETFEDPGAEFISTENLGDALRMCGLAPTEGELHKYINDKEGLVKRADPEATGKLNFGTFLDIIFDSLLSLKSKEDLMEAFRFFDSERRNKIPLSELRYILTNFGDKLSDAEMNEFANDVIAAQETDVDGVLEYNNTADRFQVKFLQQ